MKLNIAIAALVAGLGLAACDEFRTLNFDYHGGLRYPRLVRIPGTRDRLADIFAPRLR